MTLVTALACFATSDFVARDLSEKSANVLRSSGYYWAVPTFSGRDALLQGISFSKEDRDGALKALRNIPGVRSVSDGVRLIASPQTYTWLANKKGDRIQLRGFVPTEADRKSILGFIKAALPEYDVDDKMALAGGAPKREVWLGSVSFALVQLAQMRTGSVKLEGANLTIEGEAGNTETFHKLNAELARKLPTGLKVRSATILPPTVKPYDWRVKYTGSVVAFSGYAPNKAARDYVVEQTRNLFSGVEIKNAMELASGAPENWSWAVSASLAQLNRLESGRVKMRDGVIEFEGIARDESTAKSVTSLIRNSLPSSFLSSEKISAMNQETPPEAKAN